MEVCNKIQKGNILLTDLYIIQFQLIETKIIAATCDLYLGYTMVTQA